jgi:murein DD-endopeptidase MepM/ murein hydrolase activator NlpD
MSRQSSGGKLRVLLILLVLVGLVFVAMAAFRAGPAPEITVEVTLPGIGKRTPILVGVSESKRGLSDVRIEFVQGEHVETIESRGYTPRKPWEFWGERTTRDEFALEVGSETLERVEEGKATIRVAAQRASAWLRFPQPAVEEVELDVILRPPSLQVTSSFTYVKQGGAEAVLYRVGPSTVEDGVQAGTWWFPGFPLPGGGENDRFALFGAPYDLDDPEQIRLAARDAVGNEARVSFIDQFTHRPLGTDRITVTDSFLERVVPTILSQVPTLRKKPTLLESYLAINGVMRRHNNSILLRLANRSAERFFWDDEFLQMRNAKVMSDFADRRTYLYQGEAIDQQDHLGLDLASTRAAEIQAANDGVVMLAQYFGIYGNAVVIDHGYGLMSLYGHLSSITVSSGQPIERGALIGHSGQSGLAGGDHLHFTMLLHGLPVDPREWWDSHWIHDRLALKLGPALPFGG